MQRKILEWRDDPFRIIPRGGSHKGWAVSADMSMDCEEKYIHHIENVNPLQRGANVSHFQCGRMYFSFVGDLLSALEDYWGRLSLCIRRLLGRQSLNIMLKETSGGTIFEHSWPSCVGLSMAWRHI